MANKRLNFECPIDTHAELVTLQANLIRLGYDGSLNEVLNGLIFYAREHNISDDDVRFFKHGSAELTKNR
jgi:tetrahydromethanopterin S-methyltransferase subunit H